MFVVLISSPLVKRSAEHVTAPLVRMGCELRWPRLTGLAEDDLIGALRDGAAPLHTVVSRQVLER